MNPKSVIDEGNTCIPLLNSQKWIKRNKNFRSQTETEENDGTTEILSCYKNKRQHTYKQTI